MCMTKALKKYVESLVKKYGEPVYARNTRFKGEAMDKFLKADMGIFTEGQ